MVTALELSALLGSISSMKAVCGKQNQTPSSNLVNANNIIVQRVFEVALKDSSSSMDIKSWLLLNLRCGLHYESHGILLSVSNSRQTNCYESKGEEHLKAKLE